LLAVKNKGYVHVCLCCDCAYDFQALNQVIEKHAGEDCDPAIFEKYGMEIKKLTDGKKWYCPAHAERYQLELSEVSLFSKCIFFIYFFFTEENAF
jgi:hypothetical protein